MFREVRYGIAFYLSACVGAAAFAWIGFSLQSIDFPEHAAEAAVLYAPYGAFAGAVAWLILRYTLLKSPRK